MKEVMKEMFLVGHCWDSYRVVFKRISKNQGSIQLYFKLGFQITLNLITLARSILTPRSIFWTKYYIDDTT